MRLWSIHPKYLDAKGLVALWREGLLAKKVLYGKTKGYRHHPQLERFLCTKESVIDTYLSSIFSESQLRGYSFSREKISWERVSSLIPITEGQKKYEFSHLLTKLQQRDVHLFQKWKNEKYIELHPLFYEIPGGIASWEKLEIKKTLFFDR